MKILLVSEFYWPNLDGAALFEHRLAHGLKQRGNQVVVWAPASGWRSGLEDDNGIPTYRQAGVPLAGKPGYRVSIFPFMRAFRLMRRERPDVVHIHNCTQIGIAALLAARWHRIPVLSTNHAMPENVLGGGWPAGIRQTLSTLLWRLIVAFNNRANRVTTPSPIALSYLEEHGLRRPGVAISNGLDLTYFHPAEASPRRSATNAKIEIIYVGRLDYEKNLPVLLEAVAQLHERVPKLHLTLVGRGNQESSLRQAVRIRKLADSVEFAGKVSEDEKLGLLQNADIFVMPSPAELQSIATMEAMACAKPVIGPHAGALPNLIQDGENGYLFDHTNAAELAERLSQLATDAALRRRFGQAGLALMRKHHRDTDCYRHYESLYREMVAGSAKPAELTAG